MSSFEKNVQTEKYGGQGGQSFADPSPIVNNGPITRIDLRYGDYLDGIQVTYGDRTGGFHGGQGGVPATYIVPEGQVIIGVNLLAGDYIDGIQFISADPLNLGDPKLSPWYGGNGGNFYTAQCNGTPLRVISGRAGSFIDQLDLGFAQFEAEKKDTSIPGPGEKAPKSEGSYYKQIDGVKYDRAILELAEELISGKGDGRISKADAKALWTKVSDGWSVTETEARTVQYIIDNYKFTGPAKKWFKEQAANA